MEQTSFYARSNVQWTNGFDILLIDLMRSGSRIDRKLDLVLAPAKVLLARISQQNRISLSAYPKVGFQCVTIRKRCVQLLKLGFFFLNCLVHIPYLITVAMRLRDT